MGLNTVLRECPVCRSRQGHVLGHLAYALFDDLAIPGSKTLVQCEVCGMIYDDIRFSESQLQNYYRQNEHYAVSHRGGAGGMSVDQQARYDRILELLRPSSDALILDFGCGQGGFIAHCRQRGLQAVGIEPSAKSREVALLAGLDVFASLAELRLQYPQVNTIVMSHVLEHLLSPLTVLQALAAFAPGAQVYLEVPDASAYLAPNLVLWHELYFEHLSHFYPHNMADLAFSAGIEVAFEGVGPFFPGQSTAQCCFLTGFFSPVAVAKERPQASFAKFLLPGLASQKSVLQNRPLALWGVSQYAMLLMGSHPCGMQVRRLFDASAAKIGRCINGLPVEHYNEVRTLSPDMLLVLPHSPFVAQIKQMVQDEMLFKGEIVEV